MTKIKRSENLKKNKKTEVKFNSKILWLQNVENIPGGECHGGHVTNATPGSARESPSSPGGHPPVTHRINADTVIRVLQLLHARVTRATNPLCNI